MNGLYKHYRNGKLYQAFGVATNPNTNESVVVYCCLEDAPVDATYFRPVAEFQQKFTPVSEKDNG